MKLRMPILGGLAALSALAAAPALAHDGYGYGYGPPSPYEGHWRRWHEGYRHHFHHHYGERVVVIGEIPVRHAWREETYRYRVHHPVRRVVARTTVYRAIVHRTAVRHTHVPPRVIHTSIHRVIRRPIVRERVVVVHEREGWGYRHHWRHGPPMVAYEDYGWRHHHHHHWRDE